MNRIRKYLARLGKIRTESHLSDAHHFQRNEVHTRQWSWHSIIGV